MARNTDPPPGIEIAALRKQQEEIGNPMASGEGTPWEDRGSVGAVVAFFKSAFLALGKPRKLFISIRRAETAGDARAFVFLCGVFWGLSWLVHDVLSLRHQVPAPELPEGQSAIKRTGPVMIDQQFGWDTHGVLWVVHVAIAVAGTWFLINLASRLFYKLAAAGEMRVKFPPVLTFNVFAYALGPSLFAPIPFLIGPVIAVVWIFALCVYGAVVRMKIKPGGAVVCTLLSLGGVVGGAVVAYLLVAYLYAKLYA